jgi:RNA polymerase sigma-70 factor (ECF subfamily)
MARCRAYEKFGTFRGESFRLWMFKIARNIFYREMERVANRREDSLEDGFELESADNEERIVARLDCEILEKSMQHLKPKERETFSLFWIEGMLLREIREVQGGTMSGVKSRLSRATQKIRRLIAPPEMIMALEKA